MTKKISLKGKHLAWPFVWISKKIPGLRGSENTKIFLKQLTAQAIGTHAVSIPFGLLKEPFVQFLAKMLTGIGISVAGAQLHPKGRKKIINKDFRDELITIGSAIISSPYRSEVGSYQDELNVLKTSAQRVLNRLELGAYNFSDVGIAVAKLKNALKLGFSKIGGEFGNALNFLTKKKWFKSVPTTHSPRSGRYSTQLAEDYGYDNKSRWFQDVSKFSPSFLNKRRFKISGEAHEQH